VRVAWAVSVANAQTGEWPPFGFVLKALLKHVNKTSNH
jgi:hypothetical protein